MEEVQGLSAADFHALFDSLFEHSPWVTEGAWQLWGGASKKAPLRSAVHLWSLFAVSLYGASEEDQMRLIRAHPSLGDVARIATDESRSEQRGAGLLSNLTPDEHAELLRLNGAYSSKHAFPFILAVKGHDKHSIVAHLRRRAENDTDAEFAEALDQIARIGWFRMLDKIDDGRTAPSTPPPISQPSTPPAKAGL
jgi:2-oxo-4-hydroxy-4-carboxy-5-ureidoimidazoline decarboxylase